MSARMETEAFRQELRIRVDGLRLGMFVSQLDRDWIGSGFALEGILLGRDTEIDRLRALCRHVWVDIARGVAPDACFVEFADEPPPTPADTPGSVRAFVSNFFGRQDVAAAERSHEALETSVRDVMATLRAGGKLDAEKLQQGVDAILDSITRNPDALPWVMEMRRKGDYVYQHGIACAIWAAAFGRHLGFERDELRELALGALLCDVGKVRLPGDLLERTTPLTDDELARVRSHLAESLDIVRATPGLPADVARIVECHHERHDGSGYPRGLQGAAIPMFARIAGLVDSYDAMISQRPYARNRSPHEAVMTLYDARDVLFQAELVEQFIRTCGVYPTGTLVVLSDGTVGVVMAVNTLKRLRPTVMLLLGADKQPLDEFRLLDLADVDATPDGAPLNVRASLPHGAHGIDRASLFLD